MLAALEQRRASMSLEMPRTGIPLRADPTAAHAALRKSFLRAATALA
jgi:hypothetical protein